MFYNEEIAESCPDSAPDEVDDSDTTVYLSDSLNYFTGLGTGWLGDVWEKAKEKSNVALTTTKRDLTEFVTVIHRDTSNAVSVVGDSALAFTEKIVQSADGCEESEPTQNTGSGFGRLFGSLLNPYETQYTPYKDRLAVIQSNLSTYTTEYGGEEHSEWISDFKIDNYKDRISEMLVENSEVKKMHSKLVPSVVSYSLFWRRYFYREHLLKKEEEKSELLRNKDQFGWDSDSDIATPTNTRKKFHIDSTTQDSPSSSISFQQIGSPNVEDLDSDDSKESSNSRQENGSSADSFVSIEEPEERVIGSISTKDILEQKIAMVANVKITTSNASSADTSSDSIMVIEPQDMESVSPQQKHKENISKSSVIDFIQNMTVGSPIKSKNLERNDDWPDWDD